MLARWVKKARAQMRKQPCCEMCLAKGLTVAATTADHIVPHRGDYHLFWYGELQSLCSNCHSGEKQQLETLGYTRTIGADGWPVDDKHPINRLERGT